MGLSRRRFLQVTGALGGLVAIQPRWLLEARAAEPERPRPVLVVVQLAGGNDGLNTVPPRDEPLYKKLRPQIALLDAEVLPLDEKSALHAAMKSLHARFQAGSVAIVRGVGYPNPNRSHFVSTAIWQTARLEPYRSPSGWLGRAVDDDPQKGGDALLDALGVGGGGLTPALYADRSAIPSLSSLDAFAVMPDRRYPGDAAALKTALAALYAEPPPPVVASAKHAAAVAVAKAPPPTTPASAIRHVGRTALAASDALHAAVAKYSSTVSYPKSGFGDQMKLVAQLVAAGIPARLFHVTLGGFDTHAYQKNQQRNLLSQLSDGITALLDDADAHGFGERIAVLTYSEFGRRVAENGSAGTDHGAAGVLFVAGRKVKGGLYGPPPDLAHLDGGDLKWAIDFRSVYASVLRDYVGVSPEKVLGAGAPKALDLFKA